MQDAAQLQTRALTWLGYRDTDEGPDVDAAALVAPAVWSWVAALPATETLPLDPPDPERPDATMWAHKTTLGAVMLAARLIRRRNSPHGIESFTANGAAYVRRVDPDIAQLLHLGSHAKPQIG